MTMGLMFLLFNVALVPFGLLHAKHSSWSYQWPPLCPIYLCLQRKVVDLVVAQWLTLNRNETDAKRVVGQA